jgi:ubiquinone/menaquinone biosynthesis C-methylase UbiE
MGGISDDDFFWEIHRGLPREGPGDNASTQRALSYLTLPKAPDILDIACGPGMQTIELARTTRGRITALDTHQPFLDEVQRRAVAAGLADRIATVRASMAAIPFADARFDAIWCEGAIYMLGLETALHEWRRLLRPAGHVAVTHPCWLKAEIPTGARALWQGEGFEMATIEANLATIARAGYTVVKHFVLPSSAWWDDYYTPIEAKLPSLLARHANDPAARRRIDEARMEIDGYRRFGDSYGYVFFVMRSNA